MRLIVGQDDISVGPCLSMRGAVLLTINGDTYILLAGEALDLADLLTEVATNVKTEA